MRFPAVWGLGALAVLLCFGPVGAQPHAPGPTTSVPPARSEDAAAQLVSAVGPGRFAWSPSSAGAVLVALRAKPPAPVAPPQSVPQAPQPRRVVLASVPPVSEASGASQGCRYPPTATAMPDECGWACIEWHESTDRYSVIDPPYSGAFQALDSTWGDFDGYPIAADAPPAVQDQWALALFALRSWEPWSTRGVCGL